MIFIEEQRPPYKLPGLVSCLVRFNFNQALVDSMHSIPNAIWHKKLSAWEIPVTGLAHTIDTLHNYDDITLNILEDESIEEKSASFDISECKTCPYPYQKEGIEYGLSHDRWLLLDAPGLGKTLQMIYLAQERKNRGEVEHCLIICGVNTLKHNWKKEIERHSDLSCRILGERLTKRGKIKIGSVKDRVEDLKNPIDEFFIITNIETIRSDEVVSALNKGPNKIDMIISDEVHKFKSPTSQQGKNFLKLSAPYMVGLTGTLLVNSPMDAYVPLKWLGWDNSTFTNFKYYYCVFTGNFNNILVGYRNTYILQDQLDRMSLRRTKDLLDLPEKTIINELVTMESDQEKFYQNITEGIVDQVDKVELNTSTLLSMVTRLRQATACPSILTTEDISSAKIDRAVDLAEQIIAGGDKVIIYSVFKETLNVVMNRLSEYKPFLFTGDVKDELISTQVDLFQNSDENKVICATCQKVGTGLTLTAASYAIFIDTPWTAAELEQCIDRIHRIGSKDPVFIYLLETQGTFDEHVREIVEDKEAVSDFIVDGKVSNKTMNSIKKYILDLNK